MKTLRFILCCTVLLIAVGTHAQNAPVNITDPGQPTYSTYNRNSAVMQTNGKTYSIKELQNMPTTDINKIANTVGGVSSRAGETPSIRGASPTGTAYFVDGVRVYGALPVMMK